MVLANLIITVGITGSIYTPTMSGGIPITPQQIADEAVMAGEKGAAIAHICVRDPKTGKPSLDTALYAEVVKKVKSRSDIILSLSAIGIPENTLEEKLKVINELKPEIVTIMGGTVNFDLSPFAMFIKDSKRDWEKSFVGNAGQVLKNSMADLMQLLEACKKTGTKPLIKVADSAMVNNVAYLKGKGFIEGTPYIEFYLGFDGMTGLTYASTENLLMFKQQADRELKEYIWTASAMERHQFEIVGAALALSGSAMCGIENSFFCGPGKKAESNAVFLDTMHSFATVYEAKIQSPAEARKLLGLKA